MIVSDNGCGFDNRKDNSSGHVGLGLVNMNEVARYIGGQLSIDSEPGKGTSIACNVIRGRG